jgi:hypothetical protein
MACISHDEMHIDKVHETKCVASMLMPCYVTA